MQKPLRCGFCFFCLCPLRRLLFPLRPPSDDEYDVEDMYPPLRLRDRERGRERGREREREREREGRPIAAAAGVGYPYPVPVVEDESVVSVVPVEYEEYDP